MQITFLGATGTVTGSKYLIKTGSKHVLVECGLFQGARELLDRNWIPLPINPCQIDTVVLTHAHIDHSGYLPLLVKNGFNGPIFSTKATKNLCEILLPDSAYLQEEEAKHANERGYYRHHPILPLYTQADARRALEKFHVLTYGTEHTIFEDFTLKFQHSGHILGSAFVTLREYNTSLTFSGDLGRPYDPIMNPPVHLQNTDYLVLESTYGNRLHTQIDPQEEIADIINNTIERGGSVLIPAFAVGRTQTMMYYLYHLKQTGRIKDIPIYLDSPMAMNVTNILQEHMNEHKLSPKLCKAVCNVAKYVNTINDSKYIDAIAQPKIILSASGMASGGRVLHHLKSMITSPLNTILFTGYQAPDTCGEHIISGAGEVKIHGEVFTVRAEIRQLSNVSAHADYQEIINWLQHFTSAPRKVFITHGEKDYSQALKAQIEKQLKWPCIIPDYQHTESL